MRIDVAPLQIELTPGVSQPVVLTVVNTESIIGGYAVRVLGADPGWITLPTETLSLFPNETRTVEIVVDAPIGMPAGSRRMAIQVRELTPPYASAITELDLVIPAVPQTQLQVDPLVVTAGRRATFSLLVENTGNTALSGVLSGDDPENKVEFTFEPDRVSLAPGQHSIVDMRAAARRSLFGGPTVRTLSVYLEQRPAEAFFGAPPAAPEQEREALAGATFIQKSVLARGALSLVGLLIAATVFAVVITIALSRLVAQSTADRNLALQVAAARDSSATSGSSGVAGTVRLLTSGTAVPGVSVSVYDASDTSTAIATTATDEKGNYRVTDLPAGRFKLSYRGAGFVQVFYPGAATDSDATTITLAANEVRGNLNVSLGGVPAKISGTVTGDDVGAATLFLETLPSGTATNSARSSVLTAPSTPTPVTPPDNGGAVVQQVPIGSDGTFLLTNVPSPSVYDLVVVKTGYATSTQRIDVGAGEDRKNVQLVLAKGDGLITGTVSVGSGDPGGVSITATSGQSTASTVSLSRTGAFTLRGLSTPASYTLVASKGGYASQTLTVSLTQGQRLTGVDIALNRSTASLKGRVTLAAGGNPAAGVGVTLTNGALTVQTVTESAQDIGSWSATGLTVPGTYTITFTRSGLQSQTVSVALDAGGNVVPGTVGAQYGPEGLLTTMQSATAVVSGSVRQLGGGTVCDTKTDELGEATVSLTSGSSTYSVVSASVAPHCGEYRLEQIPPGTYTLTATGSSGTTPSSQVITVTAGHDQVRNLSLPRPASVSGTVSCCSAGSEATPGPRKGWSVFLYERTAYPNEVSRVTKTDSAGRFEIDDIDAGSYIIAVGPTSDPANAVHTTGVVIQPSQQHSGVKIVVDQ